MIEKERVIESSSGNIFADLGLANPEQEQVKTDSTLQIYRTLKQRGMTQANGRLMEFLTGSGQDVEITVRPSG